MGEYKITYLNNMKLYPASNGTLLRSKKDILNHLLIEYAISSIAIYARYSSYDLIKNFLANLDNKFNISKLFNSKEKEIILGIYNKEISDNDLELLSYKFEKCNVFMWALGLNDSISFHNKCDVNKLNSFILTANNYNELLAKTNIIDNIDLINYFDSVTKSVYLNESLNNNIIKEQSEALNYVLFYNPNRDKLKVIYDNNELRFEVLIPSIIEFEDLGENSNGLFAFKTKNNNVKMIMHDLKNTNIQDNVDSFLKRSYELVDVNSIHSIYLDSKIVKVKFLKKKTIVLIYYMIINKHLIRLGSLENNNNTDMDTILSIKMI